MEQRKVAHIVKETLNGLADFTWPNLCLLCEAPLLNGEKHLCIKCIYHLPQTNMDDLTNNKSTERLSGRFAFEKAYAAFKYDKDSKIQKLLELIKYKGEKKMAVHLGQLCAQKALELGLFKDIDCIIPVPLHPKKFKKRGYNQSEMLAIGLNHSLNVPILTDTLMRTKNQQSQTSKNLWDRWKNTQTNFQLSTTAQIEGKHLLLIDDVLTSGSTLEACAKVLLSIPNVKISIFTLAIA
jgi:ComF family protein